MSNFVLELFTELIGIAAMGIAAFWGAKTAIDSLLEAECEDCDGCPKPIYEPENKEE